MIKPDYEGKPNSAIRNWIYFLIKVDLNIPSTENPVPQKDIFSKI